MSDRDKEAAAERVQRFRFRVVAPDGRELVSDVAQVHYPAPAPVKARPAAALAAVAPERRERLTDAPQVAQVHDRGPAPVRTEPAAALVMAEPVAARVEPAIEPAPKAGNFRVSAIFVSAHAQMQGAIKGESQRNQHEHQIAALSLDYELRVPRDASTGHASGRHQHSALTIVKPWGAASPQLFSALVKNEALQTVEIDCYGFSDDGERKEGLVHKVKLTNARVVSIKQVAGRSARPDLPELETVAFNFQKIEHMTPDGAVLASDGAVHAA
jgi:type VI secretion system Hcp family effector